MSNTGFGKSQGRDWGGRRKVNPDDAPKVTQAQVLQFAKDNGFQIKRIGGAGQWWIMADVWRTLGETNYLALERMKRLKSENA